MDTLFSLSPVAVACAPLALGLVAVARQIGLPTRFSPLLSLILGVGLVSLTGLSIRQDIAQGIVVGLMAAGIWSGAKTTFVPPDPAPGQG